MLGHIWAKIDHLVERMIFLEFHRSDEKLLKVDPELQACTVWGTIEPKF